ncbi:hypothetical protein [Paracoccus sp. (in: a-proteobacteria)]|uniref:hypothetical protein n=1 Tax=Paracoccus sp. TaxID=267 RepID=UPI003A8A1B3C
MSRLALALLLCLSLPALAQDPTERPRAGILWNRSGLPATMPLQVRTMPGKDYVVFLTEPATGTPVMAGYIRGGEHFRLLVPPGSWLLRFAFGRTWQGEDRLFGDLTDWFQMDEPLEFRLIGINRRGGHSVRLIEDDGSMKVVDAGPRALCHTRTFASVERSWPRAGATRNPDRLARLYVVPPGSDLYRPEQINYLDRSFNSYTLDCG